MNTITQSGVISCGGILVTSGVTVIESFGTISVNGTKHKTDDLMIDLEKNRIVSVLADWEITWPTIPALTTRKRVVGVVGLLQRQAI